MPTNKEKTDFMKQLQILIDTREQKNAHITSVLDSLGVQHEPKKLDYGDYSFMIDGKDFSRTCIIERKADIDEVYGNITADRERIEKELDTIRRNAVQCVFLLENCGSWDELRAFMLPPQQMERQHRKVQNIGATVYGTLQSWKCGNRYDFQVEFVADNRKSAVKIIEIFFWYYHNYKRQIAARKD